MPGAALIFNLNTVPGPSPTPLAQESPAPKKKRTGGGGMPESNLYDLAVSDPNHPYYDIEAATEDALVDLAQQAQQIADALADAVTIEVNILDTSVVLVAANTGDVLEQLNYTADATSSLSVTVDVFDVTIVRDDE